MSKKMLREMLRKMISKEIVKKILAFNLRVANEANRGNLLS